MMRTCRFLSLLAIFYFHSLNSLSSSSVIYPLLNGWVESFDGRILESLQSDGFLKNNIKVDHIIGFNDLQSGGAASKAVRILFINETKDNATTSYVVKETTCAEEYNREEELLKSKAINNYTSLMSTRKELHFPLLTPYFHTKKIDFGGEKIHVTLMGRAFGVSLKSIRDSLFHSRHLHDQVLYSEGQMFEIGTNIGTQMGNLTKLFFDTNEALLLHPDAGLQNFIYDPDNGQFSWIDLGGICEIKFDKAKASDSYLFFEKELIRNIWWAFFPFQDRNSFHDIWDFKNKKSTSLKEMFKENGLDALKKHRLGILAANAFIEAYTKITSDLLPFSDSNSNNDNLQSAINSDRLEYDNAINIAFESSAKDVKSYLYAPLASEKPLKNVIEEPQGDEKNKNPTQSKYWDSGIQLAESNIVFYLDETFYNDKDNSSLKTKSIELLDQITGLKVGYNSYPSTDPRNYSNNIRILQENFRVKELIRKFTTDFIEKEKSLSIIDTQIDIYFQLAGIDPKLKSCFKKTLKNQIKTTYCGHVIEQMIIHNQELFKKPPVRI